MNAPISIWEVAAHAEVSVGTVFNVLNRPDIIAQPTRVVFQPELEVRRSSQARPKPGQARPRAGQPWARASRDPFLASPAASRSGNSR